MTEPINRLLLATVLSVSVPQPVYAEVNLDGDVGCQILIPSLRGGGGIGHQLQDSPRIGLGIRVLVYIIHL